MVCGLWPVDIVIAVWWYCVGFSLYCSVCLPSFSLAGTSSLLLLGSAWILNGGWKKSCPNIDWSEDLGLLSAHVKGCHCSCLSGSLPEFQVFRLLHAGSAYSRACRRKYWAKNGKSYRWEPQASWFESHNRAPSRLTLQGCVAVCWCSQKIWAMRRLTPAERKFSCRVTRTSCCLMTPNTPRGAWPPSFCAQLLRYANKLSWLRLWENSGSVSF